MPSLLLVLQACAGQGPKPMDASENHPPESQAPEPYAGRSSDSRAAPKGPEGSAPDSSRLPYVFGWPFLDPEWKTPRGGTSRGPEVSRAGPGKEWEKLRQARLSSFERDRAAILAMAGDYRAAFDFLETLVFGEGEGPARPYRSWGTERIYVIADSGRFISLQHIMVMYYLDEKGNRQGPFVQKHWRQDWRYEPEAVTEYAGHGRWKRRALGEKERAGAWSQSVFHVDDRPRYASVGRWEHNGAFSAWTGNLAWRPLPRREHTVRDDYHVLAGGNRHTVVPSGWIHEQDNLKVVLDSAGRPDSALPYRAREYGVNRYHRIAGFDFSAADRYWEQTSHFWKAVRDTWDELLASRASVMVSPTCRGEPAFVAFFGFADSLAQRRDLPPGETDAAAKRLVDCVVEE